ncbi:hypothetical protein XI06_22295 [Bradyrhizobium sp. CCBAU 11434]|uniref:hypothetical protein n=1 Tax=Bradyrhizobium sp. CCBAU 11434 TaxID=1630885 RepID=UPI0023050E4C|nr:hypothetical protein [Bradyrhizobium sp. CCBAU 11434]MDA9522933.1 hypothetical protein [Bradyrhizobium sp. CCBAU 11434]
MEALLLLAEPVVLARAIDQHRSWASISTRGSGGTLLCVGHCFSQDRAVFILFGIARLSATNLGAFFAVEEPLSAPDGGDYFAFGTLHLHLTEYA